MQGALRLFLGLLCWGLFAPVEAQRLDHVLGEVLIKTYPGTNHLQNLERKAQYRSSGFRALFQHLRPQAGVLGWHQLRFDHNDIHEGELLQWLREQEEVEYAQFNHFLEWRQTTPNDPLFSRQWQYINEDLNGTLSGIDLDAELAWDITTGGLTPRGDTIVVAVIDNGFYLNHPDFEDNIWINHADFPNNRRDEDENGYLDDYLGWNILTQNDDIQPPGLSEHGTAVAGIIGARGDNGIGVTGVNWQVKLMIISNDELFTEARVLQAYDYVLTQRQLYNDTQGEEGAFVVATNASWGRSNAFPEDAPIWCAMYDTLGSAGILNCGATANSNVDVGLVGDLPTTCPSDYLISVTNLDVSGRKVSESGFSATHIDVGAFGEQVYTVSIPGSTNHSFKGTSAATPHVTGAIALLYSTPCYQLADLALSDPAAAALQARRYLFEGVEPNPSLRNITTTGGQLNLYNSVKMALDACGSCPRPDRLRVTNISGQQASLEWTNPHYARSTVLQWREKNRPWQTVEGAISPYGLTNLEDCKKYEFRVAGTCEGEQSDFSPVFGFRSDNCCIPPRYVDYQMTKLDAARIDWQEVGRANKYRIQYRQVGNDFWGEQLTNEPTLLLENLSPCEKYEIQVQAECPDTSNTNFSQTLLFLTPGCGACLDETYCEPRGINEYEWIRRFKINDLEQVSTTTNGYEDFTQRSTSLETYRSYPVEFEPAFQWRSYSERFFIYIDYNQNGHFDDLGELAYRTLESSDSVQRGVVNVSPDALPGSTRMRVIMEYDYEKNRPPTGCMDHDFHGEIEDYCIEIRSGTARCAPPSPIEIVESAETYAILRWKDRDGEHQSHNLRYRAASGGEWIEHKGIRAPYFLYPLESCASYLIQVEGNCQSGGISGYDVEKELKTACSDQTEPSPGISQLVVGPNPFTDQLRVDFFLEAPSPIQLRLFQADGRQTLQRDLELVEAGYHQFNFNFSDDRSRGLYLLQVESEMGSSQIKLIRH